MRLTFLISVLIVAGTMTAQVNNPSFEDWEIIHTGQPYENPIGWTTNNSTNKFGLASTPVDKASNENGFYARVSSSAHGIDATLSGHLGQMIALHSLEQIEFDAQCDSLFQTGRCVVRIYDQSGDSLLYYDAIATMSDTFSRYVLPVEDTWAATNDSIRLQFTAEGGFDMWDEKEDGYSIFLIDNVSAQYISASEEVEPVRNLFFYPNPTSGWIYFTSRQQVEVGRIEIANLNGQIIFSGPFVNSLNVEWLATGVYVVRLVSENKAYGSLLFVQ